MEFWGQRLGIWEGSVTVGIPALPSDCLSWYRVYVSLATIPHTHAHTLPFL